MPREGGKNHVTEHKATYYTTLRLSIPYFHCLWFTSMWKTLLQCLSSDSGQVAKHNAGNYFENQTRTYKTSLLTMMPCNARAQYPAVNTRGTTCYQSGASPRVLVLKIFGTFESFFVHYWGKTTQCATHRWKSMKPQVAEWRTLSAHSV